MIKRTSREHVLKTLKDNQNNWNILDNNISNMNFVLQDFNILNIEYEIISGGFSQSFNLDINLYEL